MERRNFLRMMIGGVAASAAVRTFPFRVYSFPTEVSAPKPLFLYGTGFATYPTESIFGVSRYGVYEFGGAAGGMKRISQEIDIEEARRIFPGPFSWQDGSHIRRSVLMADGSVVDA